MPEPCPNRSRSGRPSIAYVAPRTELERTLVAVWSQVLEVEQVGTHDNFFDLGGSSLSSLRIIALLQEAGLEVPGEAIKPELLFEYPTVGQLAAFWESLTEVPSITRMIHLMRRTQVTDRVARRLPASEGGDHRRDPGWLPLPAANSLGATHGNRERRRAGEVEFSIDLARKAVEDCLSRSHTATRRCRHDSSARTSRVMTPHAPSRTNRPHRSHCDKNSDCTTPSPSISPTPVPDCGPPSTWWMP